MPARFTNLGSFWTLAARFQVVGFIAMALGAFFIGNWVSERIRISVVNQSALETALYLDNFIVPNLQSLSRSDSLTSDEIEKLNRLLTETNMGRHVVTVKVWDRNGRILYSNRPALIGDSFPSSEISTAWNEDIVADISDLKDAENFDERLSFKRLLEIYIPVRQINTHRVIAVAEFYREVGTLETDIASAQRASWIAVCLSMMVIYLLLVGFFRKAYSQIQKQDTALKNQVAQLAEILSYNDELDHRIRQASANAATLNERILRHLTFELTDGPVHKIELALSLIESAAVKVQPPRKRNSIHELPDLQTSLQKAVQEIRAITRGFGLPHLEDLTLPEIFTSVVRMHESRTNTSVILEMNSLPAQADLAVKITAYRIIQEALNNAYRHAGGTGQKVNARVHENQLLIEISDQGPGFDVKNPAKGKGDEHLGLAGMRERVTSLGGLLLVESKINAGTKVTARMNFQDAYPAVNG